MTGIKARYVRLVNLKEVPVWLKFSGIEVTAAKKNNKFVYTNNDAYSVIGAEHTLENTSLEKTTNIALKPNEYLGVKLERLKELDQVKVSETSGKLTLQASANEMEWKTIKEGSVVRYIRLLNDTEEEITFDLDKFSVASKELHGPSFVETNMGIAPNWSENDSRKQGTLLNVFDKNLKTKTVFADYQKKGNYITYSVGEPRVFNSLRIYNEENSINYIRDAVVQLSMDNENWTDVAEVGDGKDNMAGGTPDYADMIKDGYTHDSSNPGNYYFGNDDIGGVEAKYIRLLLTADYSARFVHMNEILINDGEYVQTENDPTFVADPIEEEGHAPKNILDGDLTTAFKPNMEGRTEGSLTYRLSEKSDVTAITIVQGANAISNAKVSARVAKDKWVDLGVLDDSLNTIYNKDYDNIFEIKLTWGDAQPLIYEMNISNNKDLLPGSGEETPSVSSVADLQKMVNDYEKSGDISGEKTMKILKLHLITLGQFEKEDKRKAVKHLNGLKVLLAQQENAGQITTEACNKLVESADVLIDKWK